MKILIQSLILASFTLITNAQMHSFMYEGRIRSYEVNLPQNFEADMPVIISLHGWSESLTFYREFTALHEFGDTAGFLVVYPIGVSRTWNIGVQ